MLVSVEECCCTTVWLVSEGNGAEGKSKGDLMFDQVVTAVVVEAEEEEEEKKGKERRNLVGRLAMYCIGDIHTHTYMPYNYYTLTIS